ncbi:MAG: Uma2 family endonuclease [Anaerolineae bacterium]|nr:Uma2 family endonuclease [Anaerolineae bacterium]
MTAAPHVESVEPITLDDLIKMPGRVEIIDGSIVEMTAASGEHQIIGGNIYNALYSHVAQFNLGAVFFDGLTYLMFSSVGRLKDSFVPDVSFIRLDSIMPDWQLGKPYPGIPTLAVEVVSPGDEADDIQRKLRTYLDKGTEQIWIIYPSTRQIYQYRHNGSPEVLIYQGADQRLDVEMLFPGLELTTTMIFALPPWAEKMLKGHTKE